MVRSREAFRGVRDLLLQAGVPDAAFDAGVLMELAAGRDWRWREEPLTGGEQARLSELAQRRAAREPLQYLAGRWPFLDFELQVGPGVLVPRADTELLCETGARLLAGKPEPAVLDLCAGSGCVGLAVAANVPDCRVVLADYSEEALKICKQNVRRNDLNARVTCVQADARQAPSAVLWDFDVIVSNPPYIPSGDLPGLDVSVRDYEPMLALDGGTDGLDFYRDIASKWGAALRLGGSLMFEVGIGQAPDVELLMAQNGYEHIQTSRDTAGIWRVVEGTLER